MPTGYSITSVAVPDLLVVGVGPVQLGEARARCRGRAGRSSTSGCSGRRRCSRCRVAGVFCTMPRAKQSAVSASTTRTGVHQGCRGPRAPDRSADALAERGDDRVVAASGGRARSPRSRRRSRLAARHAASGVGYRRPLRAGARGPALARSRRAPPDGRAATATGCSTARAAASPRGRRLDGRRRRGRAARWSAALVGVLVGSLASAARWRLGRRRLAWSAASAGRRRVVARRPGAPRRRRTTGSGNSSTSRPSMARFITAVQVVGRGSAPPKYDGSQPSSCSLPLPRTYITAVASCGV